MYRQFWVISLCLLTPALATVEDTARCDPSDKDEHCPPNAGFASKAVYDFTAASWNDDLETFWTVDEEYVEDKTRVNFEGEDGGVSLGISKAGESTRLTTSKYLFFGKVSTQVKAAKGRGVITKVMLKSDSGNEIDWEILGAFDNEAQTNYFYNGEAEFNQYNDTYDISSSVFSSWHTYAVEWTQEKIILSIDGEERRTQYPDDIPPEKWPHAPMHVSLSVWAVAEDDYPGVDAWAGGLPNWDDGPFKAHFRQVEVEDYTGYCKEVDGKVEYAYDERMVDWRQVTISGCKYKQQGMLTPQVPSGGDSITTVTGGGYPEPIDVTNATDRQAEPTASDGEAREGSDDSPTSTDELEAPPQETKDSDEDTATAISLQPWLLTAAALVAGSMAML